MKPILTYLMKVWYFIIREMVFHSETVHSKNLQVHLLQLIGEYS